MVKNKTIVQEEINSDQNTVKIQTLQQQITDLANQLKDANTKQIRSLADYQNLVKRVEKEKIEWVKFANENLLERILEIADNLDRAAIFINDQGLNMVRNSLAQLLTEYGVKEIEVLNKDFDPILMECVDKTKGEVNKIIEVKQKGYMLHEKILRPAKVVVGELK